MSTPPIHAKDGYKVGHPFQYPEGTEECYANFTARSGSHSNIKGTKGVFFVGLQQLLLEYFVTDWNENFFLQRKETVVGRYQRRVSAYLGYEVPVAHIAALHDLGYLPLRIKALPEGSFVPYGVPCFTVRTTKTGFGWLGNTLETVMSAEMWQPITSATTYMEYRKLAIEYAIKTGTPIDFVKYQLHDFSLRGMAGIHAGAKSGFAVLAMGGVGTDCIPAIDVAEEFYGADCETDEIGCSIPASEHSVMCSGGKDTEYETYYRFITELYPEGTVSIVSDTWDFWQVVTDYLPRMKDLIMNRNGKVVIRPDSGDPVEIVCGKEIIELEDRGWIESAKRDASDILIDRVRAETPHGECGPDEVSDVFKYLGKYYKATVEICWNRYDKQYYYIDEHDVIGFEEVEVTAADKGLIECLWETFGGTITDTGHKLLDEHIGAIYGDSITYERAQEIFRRLDAKGFASGNIVLGIGSYTYQYVTRDTHGMAMKSTHVVINGVDTPIFKDPKTDSGTKKSAKGYLLVVLENGVYTLKDMVTKKQEKHGALRTVFYNGALFNLTSLAEIRKVADSCLNLK